MNDVLKDITKTVSDGVRGGVSRAAFEARRLTRLQREQGRFNELSREKEDKLKQLGTEVWTQYLKDRLEDPVLISICRQIKQVEQQLATSKKNLDAIKLEQQPEKVAENETAQPAAKSTNSPHSQSPTQSLNTLTCANPLCTQSILLNDVYCPQCGTPAPKATTETLSSASVHVAAGTSTTPSCPSCHQAIRPEAAFCGHCGTKIAGSS